MTYHPPAAGSAWDRYCDRAYAAGHAAPQHSAPDLLDFASEVGAVRLEVAQLERLFVWAYEHDARRGPVLRAHLGELRDLASHAAALVAEAEVETA